MEQNTPFSQPDFLDPIFDVSEEENIIGPGGQVRRNTIQEEFARLIGRYVIGEFLIGTNGLYVQDGILAGVGENVIILYDPRNGTYTSCDLFAIKFLTYFPENSPLRNLPEEQQRFYFNRAYQQRLQRIGAFNASVHPREAIPQADGQALPYEALLQASPGAMSSRSQQSMQQGTQQGMPPMQQQGMQQRPMQQGSNWQPQQQAGWQPQTGRQQSNWQNWQPARNTAGSMGNEAVPVMQVLE